MSHSRLQDCTVFVHPQLIWRTPLFELVEQFERRGLRLWNRRTKSGCHVLTLEPATEARYAMNKQQAISAFSKWEPRFTDECDSLMEATAQVTRLSMQYQGPYCFRSAIYPLDTGKFLVLATWDNLGT